MRRLMRLVRGGRMLLRVTLLLSNLARGLIRGLGRVVLSGERTAVVGRAVRRVHVVATMCPAMSTVVSAGGLLLERGAVDSVLSNGRGDLIRLAVCRVVRWIRHQIGIQVLLLRLRGVLLPGRERLCLAGNGLNSISRQQWRSAGDCQQRSDERQTVKVPSSHGTNSGVSFRMSALAPGNPSAVSRAACAAGPKPSALLSIHPTQSTAKRGGAGSYISVTAGVKKA